MMVMLTGGQVSMAISSGIVVVFTFLLFLAGYILQQQTVRGLQDAIKPRIPSPIASKAPTEPFDPAARLSRRLGYRDPRYDTLLDETLINWRKLGYVQLVKDHAEVCTAVMLFAELHREKSPATRILMFPRSWIEDGDEIDPYVETTRRLLRAAVRRYKVVLRPMGTIVKGADESLPSSYSLASIFSLADFDRLLYLAPSGVIIDSLAMDSLLAFSEPQQLAALPAEDSPSKISTHFMLFQPSSSTFSKLSSVRAEHPSNDHALFQELFPAATSILPPMPHLEVTLYYESPALRHLADPEAFNSTEFLASTAYVRLSDPELPGPEYDVPYGEMVQLRPQQAEARWAWEKLYSKFRERRMDVCGLELLTWRRGPRVQQEGEL
ncbi:glycosyltransferase family 8 protein [Aplosporella prunicola CBS 121167]|uniref:Glycosyltransferase family 8 protein n=1 Tax=Aplosporella prunicola CBS 121167 TaxID=1176127 RepID=A0A6A6BJJ3_9PEZI|nr:glycosyltransferase family 8 protein [Aplosporella prunicola CBS 121167]KAF2144330.1 glycosyltransferase family 8 protein [Aplosporella prunicola CBS 121167]